jgi:hypothetical protein
MIVCPCLSAWEAEIRRTVVQASLGRKQDSISKITREIRVGGVAQVAENLLTKHKALSSNTSTAKETIKPRNKIVKI